MRPLLEAGGEAEELELEEEGEVEASTATSADVSHIFTCFLHTSACLTPLKIRSLLPYDGNPRFWRVRAFKALFHYSSYDQTAERLLYHISVKGLLLDLRVLKIAIKEPFFREITMKSLIFLCTII